MNHTIGNFLECWRKTMLLVDDVSIYVWWYLLTYGVHALNMVISTCKDTTWCMGMPHYIWWQFRLYDISAFDMVVYLLKIGVMYFFVVIISKVRVYTTYLLSYGYVYFRSTKSHFVLWLLHADGDNYLSMPCPHSRVTRCVAS